VFARIVPGRFWAPSGKPPGHEVSALRYAAKRSAKLSRNLLWGVVGIAWLTAWRKENGLGDSGRPKSNQKRGLLPLPAAAVPLLLALPTSAS
jgi:hypothetical protein